MLFVCAVTGVPSDREKRYRGVSAWPCRKAAHRRRETTHLTPADARRRWPSDWNEAINVAPSKAPENYIDASAPEAAPSKIKIKTISVTEYHSSPIACPLLPTSTEFKVRCRFKVSRCMRACVRFLLRPTLVIVTFVRPRLPVAVLKEHLDAAPEQVLPARPHRRSERVRVDLDEFTWRQTGERGVNGSRGGETEPDHQTEQLREPHPRARGGC